MARRGMMSEGLKNAIAQELGVGDQVASVPFGFAGSMPNRIIFSAFTWIVVAGD